jgi:micrococcal nuclease
MYHYLAEVLRVIDGDTVDALVDLGFHIRITKRLRLKGIDAPEKHKPTKDAGDAATDYLKGLIEGQAVAIKTELDSSDKYGRLLATIYLDDGTNVNDLLVQEGHAVYREY